ncbi:MAG: MucR family transcriptional regulator [Mesorhizobium sp.]
MSDTSEKNETHLEMTADIVSAYVSNNQVPAAELPSLIASISATISRLASPPKAEVEVQAPAVNPKRSVRGDHIVCLEDGLQFKSLKRHLMTQHALTPDEYRAKWNLPADYPMVAPEYAAARSELAKKTGLGRKPKAEPVVAPAKRARKPKAAN